MKRKSTVLFALAALAFASAESLAKDKPIPRDDPADVKTVQGSCPNNVDLDADGNVTAIRVDDAFMQSCYMENMPAVEHALGRLRHVRSLSAAECMILEFVKSWATVEQLDVVAANDHLLANIEGMQRMRRLWIHGMFVSDAGVRSIAKLKNLEVLTIERTHITDACMNDIAGLPRLKRLDLKENAVTDQGLAQLKGMKLEFLGLARTKITDRGIDEIKDMSSLKGIDIDDTRLTNAGLARLNGIPGLKVFGLPCAEEPGKKAEPIPRDDPADVAELQHYYPDIKLDAQRNVIEFDPEPRILERLPTIAAALRRLRHVRAARVSSDTDYLLADLIKNWTELEKLVIENASEDGLRNLAGLHKLKWLNIQHCAVHAALIARLKKIERLVINRSRLTDDCMKAIASLPRLKHLDLEGNPISDEGLKELKGKRLEFLGLVGTRITDRGIDEITEMTTLKELDVGYTKATNAALAKLFWANPGLNVSGLPRKEAHELPDDREDVEAIRAAGVYICKHNVTDNVYIVHAYDKHGEPREWMQHLKGLHSVKELTLQKETSGDDLKFLAGMKSLEDLGLFGHFTEEALKPIATLTNLKHLSCESGGITSESAKYLAPLVNLEYLNLGGEPIGDDGLRYLAGMKRLKELLLSRTRITNAGLVHLQALTALEKIDLSQTGVTGDGLQYLRGLKNLRSIACENSREAQIRLQKDLPHLAIPDK
jgi:Leucine-rich repeat (LRR) protein